MHAQRLHWQLLVCPAHTAAAFTAALNHTQPHTPGATTSCSEALAEAGQETLRTKAFPIDAIKAKWDKQFYLGAICWGKTMA